MARTTHGIVGATYNIGAGAVAINNLVAEGSQVEFPDLEGPLNPNGGRYHDTQYATVTLYALDLTAFAAILGEWQTDDLMTFVFTLSNSATLTFTEVAPLECRPVPIEGNVKGRADGFMLQVTGPAAVYAFA